MTAAATTGVVLGAVYLLWMYQRVMFGPQVNWKNRDLPDLTRKEMLVFAPLLVMIVVMGVYPGPFLEILEPSVERLLASVGQAPVSAVVQVLGGHP